MRAHTGLLPSQVERSSLGKPIEDHVPELVSPERLEALSERAGVGADEVLPSRDDTVGLGDLLGEAREEPQPRGEQRGPAERD